MSIFKGGTIPVKIVVYDGTGAIVSDAVANVFFQFGIPTVIGDTGEAVSTIVSDYWQPDAVGPSGNAVHLQLGHQRSQQ